jgi:hypothetical protein
MEGGANEQDKKQYISPPKGRGDIISNSSNTVITLLI